MNLIVALEDDQLNRSNLVMTGMEETIEGPAGGESMTTDHGETTIVPATVTVIVIMLVAGRNHLVRFKVATVDGARLEWKMMARDRLEDPAWTWTEGDRCQVNKKRWAGLLLTGNDAMMVAGHHLSSLLNPILHRVERWLPRQSECTRGDPPRRCSS